VSTIPLGFYFSELKFRGLYLSFSFLITFFISYFYADVLFYFFAIPLLNQIKLSLFSFIATNIAEIFISYIKLALFISIYCSFIILIYHIYSFLIPGLYKFELVYLNFLIKYFLILLIFSFICTYFLIIPTIWNFFLSFETNSEIINLHLSPKINEYINIILKLFLIFTFCFQLPFFLKLILDFNILTLDSLINKRHFFILFFFFFGGLISPPDIYSQIILAFICIFFLEITILFKLISRYMTKSI